MAAGNRPRDGLDKADEAEYGFVEQWQVDHGAIARWKIT